MKKLFALFFVIIITLNLFVPFSVNAETSYSIDSILISPDGKSLSVNCAVPSTSQNHYYLFTILSENESINNLTPIAEGVQNNGKLSFTINYDSNDHSLALNGYFIGISDGKNGYIKLTKTHYIDNLSSFSHNNTPFPSSITKKGLEVQYITDAQLLGIGNTVIHVYLNDIISEESNDAYAYVYGDLKYYLNTDALALLDYRVKTLTDAGINIYINFLLAFDTDAKDELYYPNAKGDSSTLFAPNISSAETLNQYAAAIHHLAERYTSGDTGFCGNYIIGYEVNNEASTNSTGIKLLTDYANEYGRLLRISYLALTSAYSNAKLFVSISNRWNIPVADSKSGYFGAREFLFELIEHYSDIPFGIAINPYPSSLMLTDFWNDSKAINSIDTEYITMKNIGILTEYINSFENDRYASSRNVVISEFGVSGVKGEESETLQAAAYAYAYYIAQKNPFIEAFIWHRHVDHSSEIGLNYGIFTSTSITLDADAEKLIHSVINAVDNTSQESVSLIKDIANHLPNLTYNDLVGDYIPSRTVIETRPVSIIYNPTSYSSQTLFDFSKSLYSFYPTDNTEYIDLIEDKDKSFMRIATLMISDKEYMGIGANVDLNEDIYTAEYITIKLRVNSKYDNADFSLILSNSESRNKISIMNSDIATNEWVTLTFPLDDIKANDFNISSFKLWVRCDGSAHEQIFIDVANIQILSHVKNTHITILTLIVSAAFICAITSIIIILINRYRSHK